MNVNPYEPLWMFVIWLAAIYAWNVVFVLWIWQTIRFLKVLRKHRMVVKELNEILRLLT